MSFLTAAAIELTLLSLLAGVVGPLIVLRGSSFFAVSLSHATFPGGVIAALIGVNVLLGQAVAALFLALLLTFLTRLSKQHTAALTGILLVFGFALGAVLSSLQTGFAVPVEALLIGSLFGVESTDMLAAAAVLCCAVLLLWVFGRQLVFETFDPAGFRAAGFNPLLPALITALLTAATVVVAMPAVGAILAIAVIVGPAATAQLLASNIRQLPPLATLFALLGSFAGLWLSLAFELAAGGAIGLVLAAEFLLALAIRLLLRRRRA